MTENGNIPILQSKEETDIQEAKDAKKNVVDFRVVPGGKDPDDPDWLSHLSVGAVFLTRRKPKFSEPRDIGAVQFEVFFKAGRCTRLVDNSGKQLVEQWVVNRDFSMTMELLELLSDGSNIT